MNNESLVTFLKKFLSLQSYDRASSKVPEFLIEMLSSYGITPVVIEEDGITSIVAESVPGKKKRVIFNGHWDTVLPSKEFEKAVLDVREDEEFLYGVGACDMKSGVAALLAAFLECVSQGIEGVCLSIVGDEELGGQHGTGALVQRGYTAPYVLLAEPTMLALSMGQKSGGAITGKATGKSAHGAYPNRGENAILKMTRWIEALNEKFPVPPDSITNEELFTTVTVSVNTIEGGSAQNVIPDFCQVKIDMRIPPRVSPQEVVQTIEELAHKHSITCDISRLQSGWQLDKDSDLCKLSAQVIEEVCGVGAKLVYKMGTNDGKYYAGNQIVNIGPGDNLLSHTPHEKVSKTQLSQAKEIYVRIASSIGRNSK